MSPRTAGSSTSRTGRAGRNSGSRPGMWRASRTDSFEIIRAPVVHPVARVAGLLIRLRAELTCIALAIGLWLGLRAWLGIAFTIAILAITAAVVLAFPWSREFVSRRGAAVMTRHRLRQVLIERRCVNFSRHAPVFLWSHPTEVGETVFLLLRAGISPEDVEDQSDAIASGCFARDARVVSTRSMTALVKVEVIRRDPLTRNLIASELADWTATTGRPAPHGARIVPPIKANAHFSGTARAGSDPVAAARAVRAEWDRRASGQVPRRRRTLDEHDQAPVIIEHPASPSADESKSEPAESVSVPPARGGDWSDYV